MDPSLEVIAAALNKLRSTTAVTALVGDRIMDVVPQDPAPASPYISLGPSDVVNDDADCVEGAVVTFQIDVWSWGVGEDAASAKVRKVAGAVRKALHGAEITLTKNALVMIEHSATRVFREEDTKINHAAMTFEAFVEVAD